MRMKSSLLILSMILIFTSACSSRTQQVLPFEIVNESIAFPIEIEDKGKIPDLIVISELVQTSQLEFSDVLLAQVSEIDFQKSLIILFIRGQLPESGTVKKIVRDKDVIIIRTTEFDPGPGSYVLPGFTLPYQIIKVTKTGAWNGNFDFILERENGEIVSRVTEFVP